MTRWHAGVLVAATIVLAALSGRNAVVRASSRGSLEVVRQTRFLTKANRPVSETAPSRSGGFVAQLCAGAARLTRLRCPSDVRSGPVAPPPADDLAASLPNLRLNIVLGAMQNVVVSGTGVDSLGAFQEPWATFKIVSTAANQSIPQPAEDPYGLPVPAPGMSFDEIPHANGLFQGIIENGCLGTPATFDLTLDSSVYRVSSGAVFGQVHLVDAVNGPGYYTFRYTVRASDEAGNVSDFVFSGDANAFCTAKSGF